MRLPMRSSVPLMLRDAAAQDMPVAPGDSLEVWIDTESEEGEVWAASTVSTVDPVSGEFMVMVTEWDTDESDPRYEEAYEEGPFTAEEAGEEWRRPGAPAAPEKLKAGDAIQVAIETDEDGDVWAAATVLSVDRAAGEFSVMVTEWDALEPSDPLYEAAYEEGPYTAADEGDEWRRLAATAAPAPPPPAASSQTSAAALTAEKNAMQGVALALSSLKRSGLESMNEWPEVTGAVEALYNAMEGTAAPPIANDMRLVGDWELVGCTSQELFKRKGLTGLGSAPFTKIGALHFSFSADGTIVAKETLEFFGKPVILNELRGVVGFSEDGRSQQEKYTEADLGGQGKSPAFAGATAVLTASVITSDGSLRLGRDASGVLVFRKLEAGQLKAFLEDNLLPITGGTYFDNPAWKGPVERANQ